jgi:hypothetical protein
MRNASHLGQTCAAAIAVTFLLAFPAIAARPPRQILLVALAGSTKLAAEDQKPDDRSFVSIEPFSVVSDGKSELSSNDYRYPIRTGGVLIIKYLAPRSHCSSIKIHFGVDGAEKTVSDPVLPGNATGYVDLGPVSPGDHVVSLRGEGIAGGCNGGTLISWGGSAIFETSGQTKDSAADELGPLVFDWNYANWAWGYVNRGCYIAADGSVYTYSALHGAPASRPTADGSGSFAQSDLLEQLSTNRKLTGHLSQTRLTEMRSFGALAQQAASGKIEGHQAANDAGSAVLQVFVRTQRMDVAKPTNSNPILYQPILLEEHGDWEKQNLSAPARTLSAWYAAVAREAGCTL